MFIRRFVKILFECSSLPRIVSLFFAGIFVVSSPAAPIDQSYTYDALNRLTTVTGGSYTYDNSGNILAITAPPAPRITIEQPEFTSLTDGVSSIPFGNVNTGDSSGPVSFTIRNTGDAALTGIAVGEDGTHQSDFTLNTTGMLTTLGPGQHTTFTVTFSPSSTGPRSAALHVTSNDAVRSPFDIALTGTGIGTTQFSITTSSSPVAGGNTSGSGSYAVGNTASVSASANVGYRFINWMVSGTRVSTSPSYQFTVDGNRILQANFAAISSLSSVLDAPALIFDSLGDNTWFGQSGLSHDNVDAARSGWITHSQSTSMSTTVDGPASVSFIWKVSSQLNFDFLRVYVDDLDQGGAISGDEDWVQRTITIPEGTHTVRWTYSKDGSVSSGDDAGYVDQVVVTPVGSLTVTTKPIGTVTDNSALAGGIVTGGGAAVIERGVVYSTSPFPASFWSTIQVASGNGDGEFDVALASLSPGTTYYVQAYAVTGGAFSVFHFGLEQTFVTATAPVITRPTVTTTSPSSITRNSAATGGNVTSAGGGAVTERGVVYSTAPNPEIGAGTKLVSGSGTGLFPITLSDLSPSTTYHVRAYAINSAGTAYGSSISFNTQANSSTPVRISNNHLAPNLSGAIGSSRYYVLEVPSGQNLLTIRISGGTGDADLYIRRGNLPSLVEWEYRPYIPGNDEQVEIDNPDAGDYYIMLYGYEEFSGVFVEARFSGPVAPSIAPTLSVRGSRTIRTTKSRLTVRGTASDANGDLAWVKFKDTRRGGSRWRSARGTASWQAVAVLRPKRSNTVQIRAGDAAGLRSRIERVRIISR
jgi:hypothetical protein